MSRFLRALAPLVALIAVAAVGCGKKAPENKLAGTYVCKPQLTAQGIALLDKKAGAKAEEAKKQVANTTMNLELRSDMTFTMMTTGVQPTTTTGKWTDTGSKILLDLGSSGGSSGVLALNVSPDLKTLTPDKGDTAAAQMETLVFTRTSGR